MWDPTRQEWHPPQHSALTSFHPDGTISASDHHNPDGSVAHSRWLYDEAGRLIESNFWMNDSPAEKTLYFYDEAGRHQRTTQVSTQKDLAISSYDAQGRRTQLRVLRGGVNIAYGIEGTEQGYGAPGAVTMIVADDENGLPAKVIFQDANGVALREVLFERDAAGKLLTEEMRVVGGESLPEAFAKIFGETFSRTAYAYDSRGRLVERTTKFGGINEARTTFLYDDRDNPIEETTEETNREANVDDDGIVQYSPARVTSQHHRLEYRYDVHGNWRERIVPGSNIERRTITYY